MLYAINAFFYNDATHSSAASTSIFLQTSILSSHYNFATPVVIKFSTILCPYFLILLIV